MGCNSVLNPGTVIGRGSWSIRFPWCGSGASRMIYKRDRDMVPLNRLRAFARRKRKSESAEAQRPVYSVQVQRRPEGMVKGLEIILEFLQSGLFARGTAHHQDYRAGAGALCGMAQLYLF